MSTRLLSLMDKSHWNCVSSWKFLTHVKKMRLNNHCYNNYYYCYYFNNTFHKRPFSVLLSDAVERKINRLMHRHEHLIGQYNNTNDSDTANNSEEIGKELASIQKIVTLQQERLQIQDEKKSIEELLQEIINDENNNNEKELQQDCRYELEELSEKQENIEQSILNAILQQYAANNTNTANVDTNDCILEIRAGTGGDEACLFANELLQAYIKTVEQAQKQWDYEMMSISKTDLGGIKEAVISITSSSSSSQKSYQFEQPNYYSGSDTSNDNNIFSSLGPYGFFKYESGVHRVQRVPINDTKIHTSACSVAVLPQLDSTKDSHSFKIPMSDLKIETMRSSGAGGQHVNTTDSAVRITHIPTNITASIQDARSQHKNKEKAIKLITARVFNKYQQDEQQKLGIEKSNLLGSGDRSERIRTYNFPQDRVTDHRCKESAFGISKLLLQSSTSSGGVGGGEINEVMGFSLVGNFYPFLHEMDRQKLLEQLEQEHDEEIMIND